jgi:NADH:ubiquinone oxidoreductase subunit 4 (subunit M)
MQFTTDLQAVLPLTYEGKSKAHALQLTLGLDGLSLFFVLLTAFTMPICILAS